MAIIVKKIKPEFEDKRGFISRLIDQPGVVIKSILFIKRKAGSVGANHYHKKDSHYLYILKGKLKHFEKRVEGKSSKIESVVLGPGDLVYTPSMIAHKDEFLEDTEFIACATENRDQDLYEDDTVRVDLK